MGKLIMWNVVTLDGYFEGGAKWDLPWHESLWSEDLERFSLEQLSQAAGLVFGRVTYEGMAEYWSKESGAIAEYMNALPKFVASASLKAAGWNNSSIIAAPLERSIQTLKRESEKDLYLFGSATLLAFLERADLVDEYRVCVAPHLHGSGAPLFQAGIAQRELELIDVRRVRNDGVILFYRPRGRRGAA